MEKAAVIPTLLVAACLSAGAYGALHNQVSYTVSPEYFHDFKFPQFGLSTAEDGRLGAAYVGWCASWWMGLIIGVPLVLIGLILPGWKAYLGHVLVAFVVVAVTALVAGLGALAYASNVAESDLPRWYYPESVRDPVAFARAGAMHNFSYLGGLLGVVTGSLYLVLVRVFRRG